MFKYFNFSFFFQNKYKVIFSAVLCLITVYSCVNLSLSDKISYNNQVKPIINKNCISCHGGVKKQSGFSLLFREEALAKGNSGKPGIVPGNAEASEMYKRLISNDSEEHMPYHKQPLKEEEIAILKKWIDEGAEYELHWSYKPIVKPQVPDIENNWVKTDIDRFIFQTIKSTSLEPSTEADPVTLARRAALDLVGFNIQNQEKKNYILKPTQENYEKYLESLLKSPHFGEKWTSMWLDLARYADTKGYERDGKREIWKYRDYLIKSFNNDKPYNVFLKEQLAGDLLPDPTEDDYVATAFHRNTMNNDEGGTSNEEFRSAAMVDRVNTTWETLMGSTFACVQCHSHPYDPFTHKDYYKFMSFFNNTRDEDVVNDYPVYRHYAKNERSKIDSIKTWITTNATSIAEKKNLEKFIYTTQPSYNSVALDDIKNADFIDSNKWFAFRSSSSARLKNVDLNGKTSLIFNASKIRNGGVLTVHADSLNTIPIAIVNFSQKGKPWEWELIETPIKKITGIRHIYFKYTNNQEKDNTKNNLIIDWLYFSADLPGMNKPGFNEFKTKYISLLATKPETVTPILVENTPELFRKNYVYERGNFLQKTEEVKPGIPKIFKYNNNLNNRLDLANWITDPQNPLVARTIANRLWEQLFGTGIVETLEDLGSQGAKPINQELLDYLAYSFIFQNKWSLKKTIKQIMLSATYRQSSLVTEEFLNIDKHNKYLARGPRIRLSAEQIRDQALYISGKLNTKMYGPPVMPFQPRGVWSSPYSNDKWVKSNSGEEYRRSVYTFWKRTNPYPSMVTFDGVNREVCSSRRIKTNTPLQAFVTLNDSVFVDLAFELAKKSLVMSQKQPSKAIKVAYKLATDKEIIPKKLLILNNLYVNSKAKYLKNKELCKYFDNSAETAAMTLVCNSILNLDEVLTKN